MKAKDDRVKDKLLLTMSAASGGLSFFIPFAL